MTRLASRHAKLAACAALVAIASTVAGYYQGFVGVAPYDDEGTMMMDVKRVLEGHALYDEVSSFYGPLYYAYQWMIHAFTGVPVSNDSVRFISLAFRLATAVLVFLLVYRITRAPLVSLGAHFVAFRALWFIADEPAHPQEVCIFLLIGFGLAACYTANHTRLVALLAVLTGAMFLTKINLGVFAGAALAVVLVQAAPPGRWWTLARVLVSSAVVILPIPLMWQHLAEAWALQYCAVEMLSLTAAILVFSRTQLDVRFTFRHFVFAALGFAASLAAISLFVLLRGSSLHAMIDWLIVRPRIAIGQSWFWAIRFNALAIPWAVIGLALAWYAGTPRVSLILLALLKLGLAAGTVWLAVTSQDHALLSFALPLLWSVAVPLSPPEADSAGSFSRSTLAVLAVLQGLYAYPVAGGQVRFTTIFMIALAAICFVDGLRFFASRLPAWPAPSVARAAGPVAALLLVSFYLFYGWKAFRRYEELEPLNVHGAYRVRVESARGIVLRELVNRASASCSTLITTPGKSFNFWTNLPTPPLLNDGSNWIVAVSDATQESVVRELSPDPHVCVIYHQGIIDMWTHGTDISSKPMMRFISDSFHTVFAAAGYQFMVRR